MPLEISMALFINAYYYVIKEFLRTPGGPESNLSGFFFQMYVFRNFLGLWLSEASEVNP